MTSKTAFLILDAEFAAGRLSPADIVVDGQNTPEVNDAIARLGASMTPELGFADFGETTWSPNDDLAHVLSNFEDDPNSEGAYAALETLRDDLIPARH